MHWEDIEHLKPHKAAQSTDIPVNVLKENADIFSAYICDFISMKHANITPVFKKGFRGSNKTIALLVFYKLFKKYWKK